jgi:hypothetical protein
MEPILGTEALIDIAVLDETSISISDLVAAHDNDIRVTVYREKNYNQCVFQGFIVVEDNSQPFLDPPFTLSVRALDGLGLLKGVDLVDNHNLRFVGPYSVIEWIANILYKTGQTLNLRVFFNWFNAAFSTVQNPLEQTYLNSITFEEGDAFNATPTDPTVDPNAINADDCYTALEKIVRCFRCRLFQEDGVWNLVNLAEYLNPNGYSYTEYAISLDGSSNVIASPVDTAKNVLLDVPIGKDEIIYPGGEDQVIYLKLATKWIKLTYTYDQSSNKICNEDLTEGDRNNTYDEVISSSIIDPSISPVTNMTTWGYDAYCWTHLNGTNVSAAHNPYPSNPPNSLSFIRSVLDVLNYEKDRFLVLKPSTDGTLTYMRSSQFFADVSDIIQVAFSWRTRHDVHFGGSFAVARLLLYGDDGTYWSLNTIGDGSVAGNGPEWDQTDANFQQTSGGTPNIGTGFITDSTLNWQSVTVNENISFSNPAAKLPVSGKIELLLTFDPTSSAAQEYWFKDLSVTIQPYLQGSYLQLKGDYNYLASNSTIKQTDSEDVEISDSPKRYFKGALVTGAGSVLLSPDWHRHGVTEHLRFQQAMGMTVYTHLRRMMHKIEGNFKGLIYRKSDYTDHPCGYLNRYSFSDADEPTRLYMLTSFENNIGTGQGRRVFVECLADQNDVGIAAPDVYQFSYVFK